MGQLSGSSEYVRCTPHPVIVTIRNNRDHIRVLLYSSHTTITGWGGPPQEYAMKLRPSGWGGSFMCTRGRIMGSNIEKKQPKGYCLTYGGY